MNSVNLFLYFFLINISILFFQTEIFSQSNSISTQQLSLNPNYKAGSLHRFIFGDNWRNLWADSISIPVINIDENKERFQKVSINSSDNSYLSLISIDGKKWKFLLLEEISKSVLPKGLEKIYTDDILEDHLSGLNPFAKIISSHLLNAVHISQTNPQLSLLTGGFQEDSSIIRFMSKPGILEEDIYSSKDSSNQFISTIEMLQLIDDDYNQRVDAQEFLKIRLMDLLLGNWNRNAKNWMWQKLSFNNKIIWKPISQDRFQSLSKFDGLGAMGVEFLVPKINSFGENFLDIEVMINDEIQIDRRILTELSKENWDSVTIFTQNALSDNVIENSVSMLQGEKYSDTKNEIIKKLKSRRDQLNSISYQYYKTINKVADVYATNKNNFVHVDRLNDSKTSVSIYEADKSKQILNDNLIFQKTFDNDITDEIRIYMLNGNDSSFVSGNIDSGSLIRVIGGEGEDSFIDSSKVDGYFISITPIPNSENKTVFYDDETNSDFQRGFGTVIQNSSWDESDNIMERYESENIDRGSSIVVLPDAGFTTYEGLILGGNLSLYSYNFRKRPYEYLQRVAFLYAFKPRSFNLEYFGEFIDVISSADIVADIKITELSFTNYFGFGNETEYSNELYRAGYNKLNQNEFLINPQIRFSLSQKTDLYLGLFYEYDNTKLNTPELINSFKYGDYGIGELQSFGGNIKIIKDTRDNIYYPTEGMYLNFAGRYFTESLEINDEFFQLKYDLRKYVTFNFPISSTIALRASGGKNWGRYPFFNAIFLGGDENLRGFTRERFSGDAAASFQGEIRTKLMDNKIIIRGEIGLHLFAEIGRAFTSVQTSRKWHPSYGGGVWTSFLERDLVFAFSYGRSNDEHNFYLDTQMAF